MKKILIIFSLIAVFILGAFNINEVLVESVNASLNYSETFKWYPGQTADTIGVGDSVWEYKIRKKSNLELMPYTYLAIDSTGGTFDTITVTLESKVFEQESYTIRESASWELGSDTVIILISDTAHISEFWKIKIIGDDDTFKAAITQLNFKFVQ